MNITRSLIMATESENRKWWIMFYIVVWAILDNQTEIECTDDYFEVFDSRNEAEKRYAEVLEMDDLYTASLCKPIKSTDHENLP